MARVAGSLEPVPVEWLVRADGFVPKARYTSAAFADLELRAPLVTRVAGRGA